MIKSAPYYWVECDNCGERCEYGEYSAYANAGTAIDDASESEWTSQGERHHCPTCPPIADCENCGKDAGADPLERDDLCQACWDAAEAKETAKAVVA